MNNKNKSESRKVTSFTMTIALACICSFTSYFYTGITNAQCVGKNSSGDSGQAAGNQEKSVQPISQMRTDALLKDSLRQAEKGRKSAGPESESVKGSSSFLADGSTGDDEPLLQKFIKKLGSIIWG